VTLSSLPPLTVAGRIDRVRALLDGAGCDALVVGDGSNIRWCTGFTGSNGLLVIDAEGALLVTDSRYQDQAPAQLEAADCVADVEISSALVAAGGARLAQVPSVGLEAASITWAEQRSWAASLADAELVATDDLVTELRSSKDEAELARMRAAAAIVDDTLAEVRSRLLPGAVERTLALALDDGMRERGAQGPAYETIVASGPNAALPHARPGDRALVEGDLVVIDAGAVVDGYRSDMTRTFVVGEPDDRSNEILDLVTRAQAAGVEAVESGTTAGAIDEVCRSIITEAGFGDAFAHGTGHGVGLDVHELPAVRRDNAAILQPGHVITVEPGVYLSGFGGVRVEDMVVVTADGCEPLTRSPKDPLVLFP
jgi:Xaa-Pro aminopeptidase